MVVRALAAWQPSLSSQTEMVGRSGYGEMLAISLGLVAVVCVVAVVLVRALGRRGPGRRGDLIEVIARQPLEPRRSLYVVRAGDKTLLLGSSEQGVTMLTELEGVDAGASSRASPMASSGGAAAVGASFGELVRQAAERWGGKRGKRAVPAGSEARGEEPDRGAVGPDAAGEGSARSQGSASREAS